MPHESRYFIHCIPEMPKDAILCLLRRQYGIDADRRLRFLGHGHKLIDLTCIREGLGQPNPPHPEFRTVRPNSLFRLQLIPHERALKPACKIKLD
jgi:hypothetical protein